MIRTIILAIAAGLALAACGSTEEERALTGAGMGAAAGAAGAAVMGESPATGAALGGAAGAATGAITEEDDLDLEEVVE